MNRVSFSLIRMLLIARNTLAAGERLLVVSED